MKRSLGGGSDSLGALISMCPASDYDSMYDGGMDEEGEHGHGHGHGHGGHNPEKKRRLSLEQVKSLEKYFEVENKLEPERKVKLAQELGLQPRQVAVWFQNRRARWKTKQLERDYGVLKSNFDTLKLNYDSLLQGNDTLLNQIKALKAKLGEKAVENNKGGDKGSEPVTPPPPCLDEKRGGAELKDGPTESDSSAIFNEDNNNSNNNNNSPNGSEKMVGFNSFSCFTESRSEDVDVDVVYQPQFVKLEEHNFMSGEEACNFFSDEAAPTLHWYCPDQWISGETV